MDKRIERWTVIYEERLPRLPKARAAASDHEKDLRARGGISGDLSLDLRFIGVAEYVLHGDQESFRRNLRESAELQLLLCRWFEEGKPIAPSYVTLLAYQEIFSALAAGAFDVAESIAGLVSIEKGITSFDQALGLGVKWFVLGDKEHAPAAAERLTAECAKKKHLRFAGYARVFEGMLAEDKEAIEAGFGELLEGHRKLSKGNSLFSGRIDEMLSVWGLGMLNLCRWKGFDVSVDDPLIPGELMVPVG